MKVLLVGGGGREHALAWRLRQEDPHVRILAAPGNPGIAELADCFPVGATDIEQLRGLALEHSVDWTLVGPGSSARGRNCRRLSRDGLPIFGPSSAGAALETSKAFSKMLMVEAGVPTGRAFTCYSAVTGATGHRGAWGSRRGEGVGACCRQGRDHLRHSQRGRRRGCRHAGAERIRRRGRTLFSSKSSWRAKNCPCLC